MTGDEDEPADDAVRSDGPEHVVVNSSNGVLIGDHNVVNIHQAEAKRGSSGNGGSARRTPATWRVPFPVDPDFVGREDEMTALGGALTTGSRAVVTQTISGLGGVGKTQLAAHVAHAVANEFHIIWWIEAEHRASMEASLRALGRALEFGEDLSSTDVLAKLSALDRSVTWMLIYDNVESPASLQGILPTRGSGVVLITTRFHEWPAWATVLNLGPLSTEAAVTLLTNNPTQDNGAAERIAGMFGCLPLALRQAAAQIRSGISLSRYEDVLRSRFVDALRSPVSLPDYTHSVIDVVELARTAAAAAEPTSSRLLVLLALLDADRVEDWLLAALPEDDPLADPLVLVRALASLKRFSLVTEVQVSTRPAEHSTRAHAMHRLVQEVIRRSDAAALPDTASLALRTLANATRSAPWPTHDERRWRAVAHLRSFLDVAEQHQPGETVALLTLLASPARTGFPAESTATWAARTALAIVEAGDEFSDADLVAALLLVHESEQRPLRLGRHRADTTAIRRALALRRDENPGGRATATTQLELARTLARQHYWWVEFDLDETDLAEAAALAESSIRILRDADDRESLVSAHVLHAGILGHLRRTDEAVAESYLAVRLAEDDGDLSHRRGDIASALLKFGRVDDAWKIIRPLFEQLCDAADQNTARHIRAKTVFHLYSTSAYERRDWPEYIRCAEAKRRAPADFPSFGTSGDEIKEHYALRSLRTGYQSLERQERVAEVDDQLEATVRRVMTRDLGLTPGDSTHGAPRIEDIVDALERFEGRLSTSTDWLYGLPALGDRQDLKLRIARTERRFYEREAEKVSRAREQRAGSSMSDSSRNLVVYNLMREAHVLARLDWNAAVTTLAHAKSMIADGSASIPRTEWARACLNMVSKARPDSSAFLEEASELLTGEAGRDARHSQDFQCTVPSLLDRAAHLQVEVGQNHRAAIELEFAAASLEEQVHGRVSPNVSLHLFNAGCFARLGAADVPASVNAVALLEEALEIAAICFGTDNPRWAGRAVELGAAIGNAQPARARSLLERADRILSQFFGPGHSAVREARAALAALDAAHQPPTPNAAPAGT